MVSFVADDRQPKHGAFFACCVFSLIFGAWAMNTVQNPLFGNGDFGHTVMFRAQHVLSVPSWKPITALFFLLQPPTVDSSNAPKFHLKFRSRKKKVEQSGNKKEEVRVRVAC